MVVVVVVAVDVVAIVDDVVADVADWGNAMRLNLSEDVNCSLTPS